jgi:hypothetical protein
MSIVTSPVVLFTDVTSVLNEKYVIVPLVVEEVGSVGVNGVALYDRGLVIANPFSVLVVVGILNEKYLIGGISVV